MVTAIAIEGRPWRRSFEWLAGLGIFFFLSYGLAEWATFYRERVPSIVFSWERFIPFLPWTIVPYMSTGFFYSGSLFLCRTRRELNIHGSRLLAAQILAVVCFLVFPLKFGTDRPAVDGVPADLFRALALVDSPFNQAPSLHVALTVILLEKYRQITHGPLRAAACVWLVFSALSTLTTYQHHVFDVVTGALLAMLCLRIDSDYFTVSTPGRWTS